MCSKFARQRVANTSSSSCPRFRCRANVAHIRQSRPDSGLGSQVKVVETFFSPKVPAASSFQHPQMSKATKRGGERFFSVHSLCFAALPTETKVESGRSQVKSGTSINFSNSGFWVRFAPRRVPISHPLTLVFCIISPVSVPSSRHSPKGALLTLGSCQGFSSVAFR